MSIDAPFVGRKKELQRLEELAKTNRANLIVIKGRRRIGKSRLAEEFGKGKVFLPFSGLPPVTGITAQKERDAFTRQIAHLFQLPPFHCSDWTDAFLHLSSHLPNEPTVLLLDEISWMGAKDPTFLPKIKVWWDLTLQKHPSLTVILCGSISTWIEKNILRSTAFFGRISYCVDLQELSILESKQLLEKQGFRGSDLEYFHILSVTGGIPWYLQQIQRGQTAKENIRRLCFEKGGMLVEEFSWIFHDLFRSRSEIYQNILLVLREGMKTRGEIQKALHYASSGTLSQYLQILESAGFISSHPDWSFQKKIPKKTVLYRLCDTYLRFYLHYIRPHLTQIQNATFHAIDTAAWDSIVGLQLENLLLQNRSLLHKALRIASSDIVMDNPYIQKRSSQHPGCQIDYLIQTRTNTLFLCEIKMRRKELGLEMVEEMQEKMDALSIPRGFGVAPVLLHVGPISPALARHPFFYRIIDISDFLHESSPTSAV